jgi:hypothetical protein
MMSAVIAPTAPALELPQLISRYVERNLPEQSWSPKIVRIRQRGEMQLQPGRGARRFSAVEDHAVTEIAFTWQARFQLGPFVFLQVVDRYERGEGSLEGRWLGLSQFVGQSGPETSVNQALRYLLELPWVPHAMRQNGQLEWRELDERSVEVATWVGTQRAAVTLEFDAHGYIIGSRCHPNPSPQGKAAVPRPWGAHYSAYETFSGVRIPTRGEVRWQSPDGSNPYLRGTITSVQLDPGPTT